MLYLEDPYHWDSLFVISDCMGPVCSPYSALRCVISNHSNNKAVALRNFGLPLCLLLVSLSFS